MPELTAPKTDDLQIAVIQDAADFTGAFECCAKAFGDQIHDNIWITLSPGWDTPSGRAAGAARMVKRWQSTTKDSEGRPNTIFLKATLPDPDHPGSRRVVGIAVWAQLSFVPGRGNAPSADLSTPEGLKEMYGADDEAGARFASQLWASLVAPRVALVREKEKADPPAIWILDLCAVHPDFQRKGIALELVRWGLEEGKRRGGLESSTEASVMGRHVYRKLGFQPVKEIHYEVDEELRGGRDLPSNLFMRTSP